MANLLFYMDMNVNCNIIREKLTSWSKTNLREPLVISNMSTILYYKRMEINNNFLDKCYDLKLKVLSDKTTLVLSDTRELDRVSSTK